MSEESRGVAGCSLSETVGLSKTIATLSKRTSSSTKLKHVDESIARRAANGASDDLRVNRKPSITVRAVPASEPS